MLFDVRDDLSIVAGDAAVVVGNVDGHLRLRRRYQGWVDSWAGSQPWK